MSIIETDNPNWEPLIAAIGKRRCGSFMWMCRCNGVDEYKHRRTRRTLPLSADGTPIDNQSAMIAWVTDKSGRAPMPDNACLGTIETILAGAMTQQADGSGRPH